MKIPWGLVLLLCLGVPHGVPADEPSVDLGALRHDLAAILPQEMEKRHLPGAVVVVVDRRGVVFAEGYGFADLDSQRPVVPEDTTFRVASVSKLLTATAVMQLVDRGRIDLDRDVNTYLKGWRVPDTFPAPITARHLLTHTAGLAERFLGSRSRAREAQNPLGVYLAQNLPARFSAPGRICSYANHGMALAGFLVESVSGLPFHEYVAQEIMRPLGMSRSSFGMEKAVLEGLAQGYVFSSGSYRHVPVDFRNEVPSGSLVTTGTDMGRFLRAFLNGGELDGTPILSAAATTAMLTRQFSHHPAMRGVGLGFWELRIDDRAYWGHDGDIVGWNARAVLAPERGLGLFVAYTGTDTLKAFADRVTAAVFDEIYPRSPRGRLPQTASATVPSVEGVYRWTRTVRDTPDRLFTPYWLVQYRVGVGASGVLELTNPIGLFPATRWEPVSRLLFQEVGGNRLLSFREEDGRITHLLLEGPIPMAFEPISRWESVPAQMGIALFFIAAFLVIGVLASIAFPRSRAVGLSRLMAAVSAANVLFLVAFPPVIGLNMFFSDLLPLPEVFVPPGNPTFFYGMPVAAVVLLGLPLCALAATGVLALQTISACRHRTCSLLFASAVAAFVALQCAFASFLHYWNLLGYTS